MAYLDPVVIGVFLSGNVTEVADRCECNNSLPTYHLISFVTTANPDVGLQANGILSGVELILNLGDPAKRWWGCPLSVHCDLKPGEYVLLLTAVKRYTTGEIVD